MNPAALGRIRRPEFALGFSAAVHDFVRTPDVWWDTNRDGVVDERDAPLEVDSRPNPATGLVLQAGRNLGGTWGIGATAYVPTNNLILFEMFEPSLPHWVMYNNRLQRVVSAAAVGGKLFNGVHIGGGINLLAKANVTAIATIDADLIAAQEDSEELAGALTLDGHTIVFRVKPALAPILALNVEPGEWQPALTGLSMAFSFHGGTGFNIDADIDLQANVSVTEVGDLEPITTALVFQTKLAMLDHFVPPRYTLGLSYQRGRAFSIYGDLRLSDWRRYQLNVANTSNASLASPFIQFDDEIEDGNPYAIEIRPTWTVRMGTELVLPRANPGGRFRYVEPLLRAGFSWEQTPLQSQSAATSLLDSNRTGFTVGLGLETWEPFGLTDGPMRFDVFGQLHLLAEQRLERSDEVPVRGNTIDGGPIIGAGRIGVFGAQLGFAY